MRKQLPLLLFAFFILLSQACHALPFNVQTTTPGGPLTAGFTVPSGMSISATGSGQITATTLSAILDGAHGGTNVNNSGKSITLGGNFITSGAFAATLTFSATTNATFPAGTHTLAPVDTPVFTTNITTPKVIWTGNVFDSSGSGSPEGVLTADIGSTYRRTNGSTGTTLYVKESGSGNTGWVAHGAGGSVGTGTQFQFAQYFGSGTTSAVAGSDQLTKLGIGIAPTLARPLYFTPTSSTTLASTFNAYGIHLGGTIAATNTNDTGEWLTIGEGLATFATGSSGLTNLTQYMLKITGASIGGTGLFANSYGIYVDIGTGPGTTWGIYTNSGANYFEKSVTIGTASPLIIKSGTNQRAGNATLSGGTVTVSNTTVTANSIVMLSRKTIGGTIGGLSYTVSAATSFTINSDNPLDTSVVSYFLIEVP